ncbi:PaaI family thioesterase [Parahaliea mediterranea]|uniref:PaaI family thioesterase n=1 Tax=Parahaliea mediterranea TaxID=651086 RepID=UPI0013005272|nr:PaaI family thioesterase [Parahaliea mediterranea]
MQSNINQHHAYIQLSGLTRARILEEDEECRPGVACDLAYEVERIAKGNVCYRYTPRAAHVDHQGTVHRGILASLLDTAIGSAITTTLSPGSSYTMMDLSIKFIDSLLPDDQAVLVGARIEHSGRRTCMAEGWLRNDEGRLIAKGTATALILKARGATDGH